MSDKKFFATQLLSWNRDSNNRVMPWKFEKDPYKIWISEIILQQTRVLQGLAYYNRFVTKFPTVHTIADAKESEVFKVWEGLGYYTRCKNIIATAKFISKELDGKFPDNYKDILQLKGIGTYTASAIASFAYNLPFAVLDGNVFRVLSRYFGIKAPIDNPEGKKYFSILANELLDKKNPAMYNQAIMDFGATICKPLPLCNICPLNVRCIAYLHGLTQIFPVKEKNIVKRSRWFYYLVVEYKNKFYVRKRTGKDIWQNLYEFILIETLKPLTVKKLLATPEFNSAIGKNLLDIKKISAIYKQQLTHQIINGQFITLSVKTPLLLNDYQLISTVKMQKLPFPKFINTYLKD